MYALVVSLMITASSVSLAADKEIKQLIIQESVEQYPGNCPCPYFTDTRGRKCGKRSAWSKKGGYSPICYEEEITQDMINKYKYNQ